GRSILCPYHQWAYDLDGRLVAAPHMAEVTGFDKSTISLYPVGVECWGGFVFVNLTPGEAGSFAAQLGEIPQRICRYPLAELRIG
ncbi:Rieske 2Fe-2S domain-containing protein, partial [Enterococcus faecium]|uniref:Rieske 2Fe-2S domain-containing protein n=1 Tax=Enterococcus faecium TaxID=1352 RepID=UPI003F438630